MILIVKKIILIISLCFSSLLFSQNRVVNIGTVKVEAGTKVYIHTQFRNLAGSTLTNEGDIYSNSDYRNYGSHHNDGNLYLNSDFFNNGTTSSNSGTTHFLRTDSSQYQRIVSSTQMVNFNNLRIDNSGGVLVETETGLFVKNTLTLSSGDLRLMDESQLIQNHSGINANNITNGRLLKDQQGYSNIYGYNYFSSPVNSSSNGKIVLKDILRDGTDSGINFFNPQEPSYHSNYDGLPSSLDSNGYVTTPFTISNFWLYSYSRGNGSYGQWIKINEASELNPGEGYTMKGTGASSEFQNYVFKGSPNNGDYEFIISAGESSLLGNPYPSALDSYEFINDNPGVSELYFWIDGGSSSHYLANYLGGYATRNLTAGAPPSQIPSGIDGTGDASSKGIPQRYIAVGQGFFVQSISSDNIIFKNSQRAFVKESSGNSIFHRPSLEVFDSNERSIIRIGYEDPEGFHRQIVLGFVPNSDASTNFDPKYDARMNGLREDDMYFIVENDLSKKYVIQGVNSYNKEYKFPLGIQISEVGIHKIMLDSLENFEDDVYLHDRLYDEFYNLSNEIFEFNFEQGEYTDRFQLIFDEELTLEIDNFIDQNKFTVYFDRNENIVIDNYNYEEIVSIGIFDILGKSVLNISMRDIQTNRFLKIPFNYPIAIYVVQIKTNLTKQSYKIINN